MCVCVQLHLVELTWRSWATISSCGLQELCPGPRRRTQRKWPEAKKSESLIVADLKRRRMALLWCYTVQAMNIVNLLCLRCSILHDLNFEEDQIVTD